MRKPSTQSVELLTQRQLGSNYEKVEVVADNIDSVNTTADNIAAIIAAPDEANRAKAEADRAQEVVDDFQAGGSGEVASVFGRSGTVVAQESDYSTFYALKSEIPSVVGFALATDIPDVSSFITADDLPAPVDLSNYALTSSIPDVSSFITSSALAPYARTSDIPDVSNFITSDDLPAPTDLTAYALKTELPNVPVQSVAGKTGNITLNKADITDLNEGDYATAAQGSKADSALQPSSSIGSISDVDITGITDGKILEWQTNKFVPVTKPTGEGGGEVNNISDTNATDLTDGSDSTLHFHSADRNRANHTGNQLASTISDFNSAVTSNTTVAAHTSKLAGISDNADVSPIQSVAGRTGAVTLSKSDITDLNEADYATSAQGAKADSALQSGANISELTNDSGFLTSAATTEQGIKADNALAQSVELAAIAVVSEYPGTPVANTLYVKI